MAASDNAGEFVSSDERVYRIELTGREFDILFWGTRYLEPERYAAMAQAVKEGDRAVQVEILRGWRVRRSELASAFSRRVIRISDVSQGPDPEESAVHKAAMGRVL